MAGGAVALLTSASDDPAPARFGPPIAAARSVITAPIPPPLAVTERELPFVALGEHYRVHTDVSVEIARQAVEWLDDIHASLVERFGAEPVPRTSDRRLPTLVFSHSDVYRRRPESSLIKWPVDEVGREFLGFFHPAFGLAHSRARPDSSFRRILVHEAAHQFHALTMGFEGPKWFVEGVAENLEHDLGCLTELRDCEYHQLQLSHAVRVVLARDFDLSLALWGDPLRGCRVDFDRRSAGFAIVRFLREGASGRYATWYRSFEARRSVGERPPRSFDVHGRTKRMEHELLAFVRSHHWWHPWDRPP